MSARGPRLTEIVFGAAFFVLLLLPLGGRHLFGQAFDWFGLADTATSENRNLAAAPSIPHTLAEFKDIPAKLRSYIADRFEMRSAMIRLTNRLRFTLFDEMPTRQTILGPTGRLFYTSHFADKPFSLIRVVCGIGVSEADVKDGAGSIEHAVESLEKRHVHAIVVLIPTPPIIHREDLPRWLAKRCERPSTVDRVMRQLQELGEANRVFYPLAAMRAAAQSDLGAFPKLGFHWNGNGPRFTAEYLAGQVLGRTKILSMSPEAHEVPSDMSPFTEGIPLQITDVSPNTSARQTYLCHGIGCFPELGHASAIVFFHATRVGSLASGKRLLLVSDSFGYAIAPWFAEYYGSIWNICTNDLGRLSNEDQSTFLNRVLTTYAPDDVVFLRHDGAVLDVGAELSAMLDGGQQESSPVSAAGYPADVADPYR